MTQEQNTNGGKNDKRTNNPSLSHYAESNAVAKLELILWHKYKNKRERSKPFFH